MDPNVFFREAVTHITSTLDIAVALQRCVRFFSTVMPADILQIHLWEQDLCSLRIPASATATKAITPDQLVPFESADYALLEWFSTENIRIVNNLESPVSQRVQVHIRKWFGYEFCSYMVLRVQMEGRRICDIAVGAEGPNRFTLDHAGLLESLRTTFGVAVSNALRHRELELMRDRLAEKNRFLKEELDRLVDYEVIGAETGLLQVMMQVVQVAGTDAPVLLKGETGVGKDVLAYAIQKRSPRKDAPFVRVNCGAIPDTLLDSELFGHEKGAFTGAQVQRIGRFERAHGGTLFLDEVGELSLGAQVKLLRVLQNGEMERVGGTRTINVDTRVIAATNRDLGQMVHDGGFRQDLFYRLNVFPIHIPPLRDRPEDIPLFADFFIRKTARDMNLPAPRLASGEIHKLLQYPWPGNVRELANIMEQAIIRNPQGPLRPIVEQPETAEPHRSEFFPPCGERPLPLEEILQYYLSKVLAHAGGKIHGANGAAELLGVNPHTLRSRMDKLGVVYKKRT